MKLKNLALVVGAALAASAAHADVTTPSYPAGHAVTLHLSSATALRDTFSRMMKAYCLPNSTTTPANVYEDGSVTATGDRNYRAYECTFKPATGFPESNELVAKGLAGLTALVYHTVEVSSALGGSIVGVMPVYRGIPMQFVTVGPTGCTGTTVDTTTGFIKKVCTPAKHAKIPNVGASDTEPQSFSGVNLAGADVVQNTLPSLNTAEKVNAWKRDVTGTELGFATSTPMFAVGFGVAATKALTAKGVTNLTREQIQAVLSGTADDWTALLHTINPANFPASGFGSTPITICRRTQGSGTQASFNAFFNSNPCLAPVGAHLPVAGAIVGGGPNGLLNVLESSTTSGIKTCLTTAQNGGNFTQPDGTVVALPAGTLAIGPLSLENNEVATAWEFIAIDGVNAFNPSADLAGRDGVTTDRIVEDRIADGTYGFYMEPTIQWYNQAICVDNLATGSPPPTRSLPALPPCTLGGSETLLAAASSNGATGDVPTAGLIKGLAELIRDNTGNPEITLQLPGVISRPTWWSVSPYDARRYDAQAPTHLELRQGIMNYTRDGLSCKPSARL